MKVLIDADGCPVVSIVCELCRKHSLPCLILCDTAHEIRRENARTFVFDKGADSVDYALLSKLSPGDLVITQDYGLASLCLSRNARVLHQDGWEYTAHNIDALLFSRYESQKLRNTGVRTKGVKKRTKQQDQTFQTALEAILQTTVQG